MGELSLALAIEAAGGDDQEELDRLTRSLQDELALLDLARLPERPGYREVPDGAKSGAALTLGSLLVVCTFSRPALRALVDLVAEWRRRTGARKVSITDGEDSITIEGHGRAEERELLEEWIRRRLPPEPD